MTMNNVWIPKHYAVESQHGPTTNVADKAVIEEMDDSLVRASTPASSLEEDSGGGPKRQETIGDTIAQTRSENVSKLSNDLLLAREKKGWPRTHGLKRLYKIGLSRRVVSSDKEGLGKEDATKQERIADIDADAGINLVSTHFDVDTDMFGVHDLVGDEVVVERINLVNTHFDVDTDMFGVHDLVGDEVVVESEVVVKAASTIPVSAATTTTTVITDDEITLAKALAELKSANDDITLVSVHDVNVSAGKEEVVEVINTTKLIIDDAYVSVAGDKVSTADAVTTVRVATTTTATTIEEITLAQALADRKSTKPKAKGIAFRESGESTTTTPIPSKIQEKGKAKMIEPEPVKKLSKKDQLKLNEEIALKLQAEIDEEERIARAKYENINEANITWNGIQAKVDADYQLAKRLQAEEQEQFTIKQKATLFKELLEQRRKHFAAKRAEEKRNKPPTKNQQKKTMITYLKNMEGWKHKDLKSKDFDSIKELFDKALKRVNMFVDFRTELVEGSSKRAGTELEQEVTKKQKVDDVQETAEVDNDQEAAKIKELMKIVSDEEEVAIDAIPLAVKPPSIVDWKIHTEGKKSYYQIIRADGKSQMYLVFSHMLKSFDREDLETLWKLVKAKHGSTRPEEGYERVRWGDLKVMFEPHVEDIVTLPKITTHQNTTWGATS
ncbi:hypothetical protein Tco_1159077 [Tanacetum coccineum]